MRHADGAPSTEKTFFYLTFLLLYVSALRHLHQTKTKNKKLTFVTFVFVSFSSPHKKITGWHQMFPRLCTYASHSSQGIA